jgi:glycine betaine/proline transport system permease protein
MNSVVGKATRAAWQPGNFPMQSLGLLLILSAVALAVCKLILPEWLIRAPQWLVLPFDDWINVAFNFIKDDLGLIHVTRAFAVGVQWLLDVSANLLYGKNRWPNIGPIPWTAIAISAFFIGFFLNGWRLGLLAATTLSG